jgi:hypothetical protein
MKPEGVIVHQGQTALKLAEKLSKYGIKIIGTSFDALIWPKIEVVFRIFNGVKHSFPQFELQKRLMKLLHCRYVRLSIIDSSFVCVGWSGNENRDQQTRTGRTCNQFIENDSRK